MNNQFAKEILEDGQDFRPYYNYLLDTYESLKGKQLEFGLVFNSFTDFLNHIKACCDFGIQINENHE